MKPRDVIINSLKHKSSDTVPYDIGFTHKARQKMIEYYNDEHFETRLTRFISNFGPSPKNSWTEEKPGFMKDQFGVVWDRTVDEDIGVPVNVQVTAENVDTFELPDPDDPSRYGDFEKRIAETQDQFRVGHLGFSLYERVWTLAGMENTLMAMVMDKPFMHRLFDRVCEFNLAIIRNCNEFDLDAMHFGDDWGTQTGLIFGYDLWCEFVKPRIRKMYSAVKEAGRYVTIHSCGKVDGLFDDLIECGLDMFNPFQPEVMDVFEMKKKYGDRLTFHGGISTQKTLPYGTPEETRAEVESLLEKVGKNGGYVCGPAHATPADAKPENIAAMIDVFVNQ